MKRTAVFFGYPRLAARGGAEGVMLQITEHVSARRKVFLLTGDGKRVRKAMPLPPGVRWLHVPYGGKNVLALGFALVVMAYYLIRFKPAIVHTHHRRLALLFSALKGLPLMRFKLIHTSHNVFRAGRLFGRARCDLLTGVSRSVVRNLVEEFGFPEAKVRLIYNGIPEYDREMPPCHEHVALIVARLTAQKGHRYLIEAWAAVVREVPDAVLRIVGDGELREELESQVRRLGLSERIFFDGFDPCPRDHMRGAAFGILPSLWEGLPLFPLEAFSVKRTVVATAVDGTPEIVIPGKTGLLVPPENVGLLAAAVIRLFKENETREAMAEEGYRLFKRSFTADRMLAAYDACYAELAP